MTAQRTAKVGKYNEPNPRTANLPEAKKENVAQVCTTLLNAWFVIPNTRCKRAWGGGCHHTWLEPCQGPRSSKMAAF